MLEFRLNGRSFLLDESTSVKIKWVNPACFHDKLIGDVGLGITFPDNRTNRALLGNPERFDKYSSGADRKFPGFEILKSGVSLLRGLLVLKGGLNGWLQSEYGALREEQKEKKITEMAWPVAQNFVNKAAYTDDADDYNVLPLRNHGFWDGIGKEVPNNTVYPDADGIETERPEKINEMQLSHFQNFAWMVNQHNLPTVSSGLVISPQLFLRYVIKESLRLNGWFIGRNDIAADFICANLSVYNNFNIVDILPETELKEDWTWDYILQRMVQIGFHEITNYGWGLSQFAYRSLLPKISYADFLIGIQNYLNFVFRFRSNKRVDIIDRNAILASEATDLDAWHMGTWEMGDRKDVTLKFVQEIDKDDAEIGSNYEDLTDRRADFLPPVDTYADLENVVAQLGKLCLVRDENRIYEYKWMVQTLEDVSFFEIQRDAIGWEFVSSGPQPYLYGSATEIEEIKTCIGPVQMEFEWPSFRPVVNQKGNLSGIPSVYNDFTLRLLSGGILWPTSWDGETGFFKNRWQRWARFWKNRQEVTAEFNLPLNVINYLVDNITGKFRTREGEFIIEEMECEFGMNAIGKTTIKGYKI